MASKSRDETQASMDEDRKRAADGALILMKRDPSDRKAVLPAKAYQYGVSSDFELRRVSEEYFSALEEVDKGKPERGQELAIRRAIEHEFQIQYEQRQEPETMQKLAERVENLEYELGRLHRDPQEGTGSA